jgi:ketosteroid isomerase-like protein
MKYFFVFLCSFAIAAHSQIADSALQSLVNAERAFISAAKEKNTRDAFIEFLADDAVTFGKNPIIGTQHLKNQQPNESWLYWDPVYSDIAASGDFGFNTGPWEFRNKRTDEKPVAYGEFVTVWKKVNGKWKAAIDIGVTHDAPKNKEAWKTSSIRSTDNTKNIKAKAEIIDVEQKFQSELRADNSAYKKFLSREARFYRTGKMPFITQQQVEEYLRTSPENVSYTMLNGSASAAGDMAFVYGSAIVHEKEDHKVFYMRIWKKENNTWKIVLDILS